ncbi:unnamed protein product [Arabidopsis lyrata]|uniref:Uncharacterized protein n=1 Tax=Arabidopsis lyrata subsp. lyrata TaxID=81972 RepID=D7KFG2_ARALL|nr:uncharacterized protein LOC9326293 [Arabidopsis lyrata subsp. lyrata]EFH69213.1 hypothetical protein ARALYDRAFT_471958 [Arabidopsis lyrata subsp. lyrata]CAH8252635.1 unnamed protein product [Arabidopsis lyrata]|eukprot:XP_020867798.1 uncharacterized protein LOC9326293 [Arabidopsis lyrata subsp. lyrata]
MAIKAGKVLRTATAAARKFQQKQFSATSSAPVSPSSGVGSFLGIPKIRRSESDLLISKYIRLAQGRLTKKGDFTEEKLTKMLSGEDRVGIGETMKLLEGRKTGVESSKKTNTARSNK